jgi:hypothetical protein
METRMERRKPVGLHSRQRMPEPLQAHIKLAAMAATAALPLMILASLLPRPLVLPVVCLIAVFGAGLVSFVAWKRDSRRDSRSVTAWDIAGALTFIACAAAIMSNPEHLVHLTDGATALSDASGSSRPAI